MKFDFFESKKTKTFMLVFLALLGAIKMEAQTTSSIEELIAKAKTIENNLGNEAKAKGQKITNEGNLTTYAYNLSENKKIRVSFANGEGNAPTEFYGMESKGNNEVVVHCDVNGDGQNDYIIMGNTGDEGENAFLLDAIQRANPSSSIENEMVTAMGQKDERSKKTVTLICFQGNPYILKPNGETIKAGNAGSDEAKKAQNMGQVKFNNFLEK